VQGHGAGHVILPSCGDTCRTLLREVWRLCHWWAVWTWHSRTLRVLLLLGVIFSQETFCKRLLLSPETAICGRYMTCIRPTVGKHNCHDVSSDQVLIHREIS
jgi:hypothetical protein